MNAPPCRTPHTFDFTLPYLDFCVTRKSLYMCNTKRITKPWNNSVTLNDFLVFYQYTE